MIEITREKAIELLNDGLFILVEIGNYNSDIWNDIDEGIELKSEYLEESFTSATVVIDETIKEIRKVSEEKKLEAKYYTDCLFGKEKEFFKNLFNYSK